MSCLKFCHEGVEDPAFKLSRDIDKQIHGWMKQYNRAIKLLLLGAGESGKTTIIKQMKILHGQSFSPEERQRKVREIKENILESIQDITHYMGLLNIPLTDPSIQEDIQLVQSLNRSDELGPDFFAKAVRIWSDEGVRLSYQRSNEYPLIDCAKYFLDNIDRIRSPDYVPTDQDMLRSRRITSEIQKIEFSVKVPSKYGGGSQSFWMFDVGGQRGERRKWIQVFDGISAVLFLVASSGFNTKIREDNETNRLQEALSLFQEVWSSRFLREAGFILFLNKQDILREKIELGARMEDNFPEFLDYVVPPKEDDPMDSNFIKARCFIRDKFLAITRVRTSKRTSDGPSIEMNLNSTLTRSPRRECFYHFTTATDTNNIQRVFDDVHTMIILSNLKMLTPN